MEIKWTNIIVIGLVLATWLLYVKLPDNIELFPSRGSYNYYSPQDRFSSLLHFGLLLVAIVAVVKIMVSSRGK